MQLSKGDVALVATPETQRAKELLELFNAFNNSTILATTEQRLDVLLNIKVLQDWKWMLLFSSFLTVSIPHNSPVDCWRVRFAADPRHQGPSGPRGRSAKQRAARAEPGEAAQEAAEPFPGVSAESPV